MKYGWRDVPNIRHNPTTDEDDESGRPMSDKEWRMKYISALLYCVSGNNIKRPEREWYGPSHVSGAPSVLVFDFWPFDQA